MLCKLLIQFNHITFILTDFCSLYSIRIFHVSRKHFILSHCRSIDTFIIVTCPIAFVKAHRVWITTDLLLLRVADPHSGIYKKVAITTRKTEEQVATSDKRQQDKFTVGEIDTHEYIHYHEEWIKNVKRAVTLQRRECGGRKTCRIFYP